MRSPLAPASRLLPTGRLRTYGHLECCVVSAERVPGRGRPLILVTGVVLVDEPTSGIDIAKDESPSHLVVVRALLEILVDAREDHVLLTRRHRDQGGLEAHFVEKAVAKRNCLGV